MAPHSCTVAVETREHQVTIHFKSDNQVRRIYVHPDNVVLKSGTLDWSKRHGSEYTFYQNKYQARVSIQRLSDTLKKSRSSWDSMGTDDVMAMIYEEIGMSPTLWEKISKWVKTIVSRAVELGVRAIGLHATGEAIEWRD